jgi:hypothetical protein
VQKVYDIPHLVSWLVCIAELVSSCA